MSAFVCVARACSSIARVYTTLTRGLRPCLGLPRVNEYAAVAGWLVKTVALLAYPFLPPPPPAGPPWSPSGPPATLLHVPLARLSNLRRLSTTVSPSRHPRFLRSTPRPPARCFFPRFPYLSDIPLPASTRVDVRLIRLKSRREATNYYASWSEVARAAKRSNPIAAAPLFGAP